MPVIGVEVSLVGSVIPGSESAIRNARRGGSQKASRALIVAVTISPGTQSRLKRSILLRIGRAAVKTVSKVPPLLVLVLGSSTEPSSLAVPWSLGEDPTVVSAGGVVVPPATTTVTKLDCLLITSAT